MHLEAKDLVKTFKRRSVVDHVSLRVDKGEIVGLLGPNGAGKTTTFYMITGLERPTSGDVFVSDVRITSMPMYARARLGISYLAQEASIFRKMTVEENLLSILEMTKLSAQERREKMENLLAEFRIGHVRNRLGTELSGGERRRVEIARCLAIEPQFILLDEPFAGVDPIAVADIQELITDHNVRETLHIVDRAYILNDGKILLEGDSATIAASDLARKFYLGDNFTL